MRKLDIYDPALCCSTGVCGPAPEARLAAFASAVSALKNRVQVNRYNLAQEPGAFAGEPVVNQVLKEEGPDALPVILIDGKLVLKGIYPTSDQLAQLLGLEAETDCCSDGDDCCEPEEAGSDTTDCCEGSSCC